MSQTDALFAHMFAEIVGIGVFAEPPDSIPLRLLGLSEKPATRDAVQSAFRERLKRVHPDIPILESLSLLPEDDLPVGVQELVWARDILLRKVPPAAVTGDVVTPRDSVSRYTCKSCQGERRNSEGKPYRLTRWRSRWAGYCWPCAIDAENERQRELRWRVRANRICKYCGQFFTPTRSDGRYCSSAHRQAAYRQRQQAA